MDGLLYVRLRDWSPARVTTICLETSPSFLAKERGHFSPRERQDRKIPTDTVILYQCPFSFLIDIGELVIQWFCFSISGFNAHIRLFLPEQLVCYAELGNGRPNRAEQCYFISALLFHPNELTWLFSECQPICDATICMCSFYWKVMIILVIKWSDYDIQHAGKMWLWFT